MYLKRLTSSRLWQWFGTYIKLRKMNQGSQGGGLATQLNTAMWIKAMPQNETTNWSL